MKRIGLTLRSSVDHYQQDIQILETAYLSFMQSFNVQVVLIPTDETYLAPRVRDLDGIVLSGGEDLNPQAMRTRFEMTLLGLCREQKIPVFGICRGLHVIMYKVLQCMPIQFVAAGYVHPPARGHEIMGAYRQEPIKEVVNSFHHWGYLREHVKPPLQVFAVTSDGVVEGIVHETLPWAAIQWHPERPGNQGKLSRKLFQDFITRDGWWQRK